MISKIVGMKILRYSAGENTGSIVNFEIGDILKEKKVGKYKFLEGDYSIMINCSWRIVKNGLIIATAKDINYANGPMLIGLESLIDRKIIRIKLSSHFDLAISLEDTIELNIFCDISNHSSCRTNWHFTDGENGFDIFSGLEEK
jgi:hypothetical protein